MFMNDYLNNDVKEGTLFLYQPGLKSENIKEQINRRVVTNN
jgi:hypothetical protein